MAQYRPVPDDRRADIQRVLDYAFDVESGPQTYDEETSFDELLGDQRGLFEDGELRCLATLLEFEARFRGDWITLGGLRETATLPQYRRQGYVTKLVRESLAEFRDREVPLVALWPFEHDFYRQLGWGTCQKYVRCTLSPGTLASVTDQPEGTFRQMGKDDWDDLKDVHLAAGEGITLSIDRPEAWWRHRFRSWSTDPYVYAYEREGTIAGYVVYSVRERDEGKRLEIRELNARDGEARAALLWLVHNHDSQVDRVQLFRWDAELLDMVATPEDVDVEVEMGPQVRIVDVGQAFDDLPAPDREMDLRLEVEDDLAEWNDTDFRVRNAAGNLSCRAASAGEADATVDIATLSQLLVGYLDVETAAELGRLSIYDEETRADLDALFPPQQVGLREYF